MGIDFHVGLFKVGSVSSSAGVFVGENEQTGWNGSSKANFANGRITGDYNCITGGTHRVNDEDMLDTWIQKHPERTKSTNRAGHTESDFADFSARRWRRKYQSGESSWS